jgi:hypothetical protein
MRFIISSMILLFSFSSFATMNKCNIYWAFGRLECSKKSCYQILNKGTLSESVVKLDDLDSPGHGIDIVTKIKILNKPSPNRYKAKVLKISAVDKKHEHGHKFVTPVLIKEGTCEK